MDVTQARELYSAYYEGTIERISAVALEEAMKSNPDIHEDYHLFASVMDSLPGLAEESVEFPADLHDKVMAKIDHYDWEKKQEKKFSLFAAPRMAWYGLAAAALILFAATAVIQSNKSGGPSQAATGPVSSTPIEVSFTVETGTVTLNAVGPLSSSVVLTSPEAGVTPQSYATSNGTVKVPLQNQSTQPRVIEIAAMLGKTKKDSYVMVLPGTKRTSQLQGEGSIIDCAKAVSTTFGTPVQVEGDPAKPCRWALTPRDTSDQLVVALGRTDVTARVSSSGLLQISAR